MLRQLRLKNYRCFSDYTVLFERATVVVGKNNARKSTLVEALELVSAVVNRKGANFVYPPRWLELPKFRRGIAPSISHLGLNLSTVFHRYGDPPTEITATFEDGATVTVYLGAEQTIFATVEAKSDWITSSGRFLNLSLNPQVIRRVIIGRMKEGVPPTAAEIEAKLLEFCEDEKETVLDGIAAELMAEDHSLGVGANKLARTRLAPVWEVSEKRLSLVSGKSLVSKVSTWSQKEFGVSFGANAVAKKFRSSEVPAEVESVLQAIEEGDAFSVE